MVAIADAGTRQRIINFENEKKAVCVRLKSLVVADNMQLLDFSNKDKNGFVEYEKGLFIRDITSNLGAEVGITSLHLMVKYDMEISSHQHVNQNQTIWIKYGQIYDMRTKTTHHKGSVFPIEKKHIHQLKYFAGSEYVITFMPKLNEVED